MYRFEVLHFKIKTKKIKNFKKLVFNFFNKLLGINSGIIEFNKQIECYILLFCYLIKKIENKYYVFQKLHTLALIILIIF